MSCSQALAVIRPPNVHSEQVRPQEIALMKRLLTAALILTFAALACGPLSGAPIPNGPAPGSQEQQAVSRTVIAYEDTNGSGTHDDGEALLPDVLIIADSNIHGSFTRIIRTTDSDGIAIIQATYTHFFDLYVVPPCGYTATSSNRVDATESPNEVMIGFQPTDPQPGIATIRFHMWEDVNANGVQDEGEAPVDESIFAPEPVIPGVENVGGGSLDASDTNDLRLFTDAEGRAEITLGNSCGTIRLRASETYRDTSSISPEALTREDEEGVLFIPYSVGENIIEWGLTPIGE
jgi:hypothetical protein